MTKPLFTLALTLSLALPQAANSQSVDEQAVRTHVERLKTMLIGRQHVDGSWPMDRYTTGLTALAVLALKQAGLPNDHPTVRRGAEYLVSSFDGRVYSESLVICALEQVDPKRYRDRIREAVRFLIRTQSSSGMWSYERRGGGDNSNTQFAVLGLAAAERCGIQVSEAVKRRAAQHWISSQGRDGGWSYGHGNGSYLSMTCAGIASLHLMGRVYEKPGAACGEYIYDSSMKRGLAAMLRQVKSGNLFRRADWSSYTLYALERVGIFLDLKDIGGLDWYRWGAAHILHGGGQKSTSDLAFDLLFLARGDAQVAIAKWRWAGDWNNDHDDVKNWVALGNEVLGKGLPKKLDWIPARLDDPQTGAAKASLIFVSGHDRFEAGAEEALFLRRFLAKKGTLVAEGCCNSRIFVESFQEFVRRQLFPKITVEFRRVEASHPICRQRYTLAPNEISVLHVKTGCHDRRIIILEKDISCALNGEPCDERALRRSSALAVNLLEWAIRSRAPRGRLADARLTDEDEGGRQLDSASVVPSGLALRYRQPFGRLVHRGEWDVDSTFFPTLARALDDVAAAPRLDGEVFVLPRSDDLFACSILYVTGHGDPRLRSEERLPLRRYLQNGGTIIAVACCGLEDFDAGFRRLIRDVLPNDKLEKVPVDDAVWRAAAPRDKIPLSVSRGHREKYGLALAPLHGVRREGRWAVFYSPSDLCCDLEGDLDENTVAYKKDAAIRIWLNLLKYVFTP